MSQKRKQSLIYGVHAVASALENDPANVLSIEVSREGNARVQKLASEAKSLGISVRQQTAQSLDKQVGRGHQGIVAHYRGSAASKDENDLYEMLDKLEGEPFLLLLDGVTDPHNLGACLRSAAAAGVDAVIVPKDKSAGITPVVRKVSVGAVDRVLFVQVTNLARTLESLKARGVWIYGAAGEAKASLYQLPLKQAVALVLGAEGAGLRSLTRRHCDDLYAIPMQGEVESLNVSVATGISLFEVLRQRQ